MALLFECPAVLSAIDTVKSGFVLQIATVENGAAEIAFVLVRPDSTTVSRSFALKAPHGIDHASFSYDKLDQTITLELVLDPASKADLQAAGLAGFDFKAEADLVAVKIILRPRQQGGEWSAAAPCFALTMCWQITAAASSNVEFTDPAGRGVVHAGAQAAFEVCAGLALVRPPTLPPIGFPDLQLRLDLPSLSLSTAWVTLPSFLGLPDTAPIHLGVLLRWFGDLIDFDWSTIAFPIPPLPQWECPALPLVADLPLGIGADQASVRLHRAGGRLALDASASGFYLSWQAARIPLPGELHLRLRDMGEYEFFATLYRAQYPAQAGDPVPYAFSLPFGVLRLAADCWYFRAGLFSAGEIGGKHTMCFEILLEVGGLAIASALAGADGDQGLYRTDLRLLVRDFTVVSNAMTAQALAFFRDVEHPFGPFAAYAGKTVPALSFAADLLAPPPPDVPANEYGLTFLDGDFRAGERLYVLWRQRGLRFLRALAHDLLGRPAAGAADPAEPSTLFGLEVAYFAQATQIRLDWRDEQAPVPHANAPMPVPPPALAPACWTPADSPVMNLPFGSAGVDLALAPAAHAVFDLPAIRLELARPGAQAIVIRQAKGDAAPPSSVSHLAFFPPPAAAAGAAPPLARAKIGFSMSEPGDDAGREVIDTEEGNRFVTLGLGYAGQAAQAVRTVGWADGGAPRFLQTLDKEALPLVSLIPATLPATLPGDPGCPGQPAVPRPPASVDFDAFGTPRLGVDGWRLSIELAAASSLFKMFKNDGAGQSVQFRIVRICETGKDGEVAIETELTFNLGNQFQAAGAVTFLFDLRDLSLRVADGAELAVAWKSVEMPDWAGNVALPRAGSDYWYSESTRLFGLTMTALAEHEPGKPRPATLRVLTLSIHGGRFVLSMADGAHILLRYTGLGKDALNFWVSNFALGPGGLDLDAALLSSSITVKGLSRPFLLEKAALRMRSSKLDYLSIDASGKLPELLNEAPVSLTIAFAQRVGGAIDLDEMHCELGDKDTPILSRGTRFKFEITNLTIQYARATPDAEREFYFELSGAAQFTPDGDEFSGGLLEDIRSARIEFLRAPLSDDFIKHLSVVVELKRPVVFKVLSLFRMEIRSIGFEPWCTDFAEPGPAVLIGGQCEFAKAGDVVSADISFHAMKIGMPRRGDWKPQVFFDKLRVDISTAEGFRIGGRVDRYDTDTLQGFAGEGTVQVPGFPEISAAFSFVRLRANDRAEWQHAWFVAIAAAKISYQVGPLPVYLRQIGLGFGYRYTLPLIADFDTPTNTMREMITTLMKALDNHATLDRIDSWTAQPGDAKWTIALEAVFTLATANTGPYAYDQKREQGLKTLVLQTLAAFRSDFTILAGMKMWYPVSVDDFFRDVENMRRRPLVSGFMIYSAPQNRFLAHAASGQDPYMGPKDEPVPEMIKDILRRTHFEATLLVEPGLIHGELGWPDRLMFDMSIGSLKLQCRGGVLFRLERDILIQGTFFSAQGSVNLGGTLDGGFIGVRVEAFVQVQFSTRLLTAVYLADPLASKLYAALGLDIAVRFSISAWLRIKIGFIKISLDASFSIDLQVVVALELGWAGYGQLGFKGRARISIGVFGRSVGVSIAVGINDGGVDKAKEVLGPYMGSLLGPGEAPPMPGIDQLSRQLVAPASTPALATAVAAAAPPPPPDAARFVSAHVEGATQDGHTLWFVWIMPGPGVDEFYPTVADDGPETGAVHYADLTLPAMAPDSVFVWKGAWTPVAGNATEIRIYPNKKFGSSTEHANGETPPDVTLQRMIAGCWLPEHERDDSDADGTPFPFYWPGRKPALVAPARPRETARVIRDERVYDPADAGGTPNRRLDASHHYDNALMAAMDAGADPVPDRNAAAVDNQNFLLHAFHDDLVAIAASTYMDGNTPATPANTRAGLRDTGMLICVRSERKPDWMTRLDTTGATAYPSIAFRKGDATESFTVRPVIDGEMTDFARNPPVFSKARAYFDEDIIGLAWELEWGGAAPTVTYGARSDVEAFLRAYRISFVDLDTQRVIRSTTVTPTRRDIGTAQIDLRYRFTIGRADVFGALPTQRIGHVGATITPISQTGQAGAPFTIELEFVPALTPLPPDNAELELRSADHGASWDAVLRWRQLALPARPGVAITRGWHLILRPLRAVPLGAYPDEAVDVTDRGLMSASGQALIDGDILIRLNAAAGPADPGYVAVAATDADNDGMEPAERIVTLALHATTIPGTVYDHRGMPQAEGAPKHAAALRFFRDRASAAGREGSAWRLFLRASTEGAKDDVLLRRGAGVSGLGQVKLLLRAPAAADAAADARAPVLRALPHFEWPTAIPSGQVAEISAKAGPLSLPLATRDGSLTFRPRPGRSRAVRIEWNALPAADDAPPLQAFAAYDVYELRLDTLVNADCDPAAGFEPEWTWLRRVVATDAAQAAQIPATMAEASNWEAQYPAFAHTVAKLEELGVPARDMTDRWPGWYSWDESRLRWPAPPLRDDDPAGYPREVIDMLADGRRVTRVRLHTYLTLLIGHMAQQARTSADAPYDLQLVAGTPNAVADPLKWLEANTDTVDPYGWAALAHLGLSTTLTMRDPLTGMLLPQHLLRAALQKAVDAVDAAGATAPVLKEQVDRWRPHLMTELPVQYLRAYGAGNDAARLDDAALGMLQVSLRPVPERVATYLVFTVGNPGTLGATLDKLTDGRVDIRFPADSRRQALTIRADSTLEPGKVFLKDDLVMVRDYSSAAHLATASLPERLRAAGVTLTLHGPEGTYPFGVLAEDCKDPLRSPFGVFGQPDDLATLLPKVAAPDPGFAGYLADAFLTSQNPVERTALAQAFALDNPDGKTFAAYVRWSARFFGTAPLVADMMPDPSAGTPAFAPATAIAQPKTADPLKIAADGKGRLSLTHFVEEEWAGERSYAVVTVGRYERLRRSFDGRARPDTELRQPPRLNDSRADVALERVRRLQPPTLLLARTLRSSNGRQFHELVMSHAEATLSQQNMSVIRKLEFNDIVRGYLRTFPHGAWAKNVADATRSALQPGLPQPLARTGPADTAPYDIDADADPLMAAAPQARWNATRYVDAAEPFYYSQTVRYRATAATDIESGHKAVVLPSLAPDAVTPLDGGPVRFGRRMLKPDWHDRLDAGIRAALESSGHLVTVRLPRLAESLAPQARTTWFAYECRRYRHGNADYAPVGLVPDPDVKVLLLDRSAHATATIAQLAPRPDVAAPADAQALFAFAPLSADFAANLSGIAVETDWAAGLHATFDVNAVFGQCAVAAPQSAIAALSVPDTLVDAQAEPLSKPAELPGDGPLAQLAPLAARMTVTQADGVTTLAMTEPLTGPAWLCRPHLPLQAASAPIGQHDLAIGLRMVADTERRTLAALVAFDCATGDPAIRALLARIEESALAMLLETDREFLFEPATVRQWASAGITLWRRFADPEAGHGTWEQVKVPDERPARYSCVLCEPQRATASEAAQIRKEAWATLRDGWIAQGAAFDPDRFDRLSAAVDTLAGLAYRRAPLRRPAVYIQRGNEQRTPWPPLDGGEGDSHA